MERVGIVGYNQVKLYSDANYGRYEMIFEAVRGAIDKAGLKKKDITTVISCTNDYYDGRTISNCFTVEVGFIHFYNVTLELDVQELTVEQGEYISTNVTVTNTGNSVDMIEVHAEPGILDANVALEHSSTPIRLNVSESKKLKLKILVFESTKARDYTISITAISNGALSENQDVSVTKSLQLKVIEKKGPKGKYQEDTNLMLWIIILIIIIILVVVMTIFIYRKKQAKKIPTLKAEILHAPPVASI